MVIDDSTGAPVLGDFVVVELEPSHCLGYIWDHGLLQVAVPGAGRYTLRFGSDSVRAYVPRSFQVVVDSLGAMYPATFHLAPLPCVPDEPQIRLTGVVRAGQTRAPQLGARVRVVGTNCEAQTDSLGRWTILGVPSGRVRLQALLIGFVRGDTVLDLERARSRRPGQPSGDAGIVFDLQPQALNAAP
jgi:hypothetical protein